MILKDGYNMAEKADEKVLDSKDVGYTYIPMVIDSVSDYEYDKQAFSKGVDTGSYLAGIATAIKNMNADIDKDDIVEILKTVIENDYRLEN